jgi:hypothetical protein
MDERGIETEPDQGEALRHWNNRTFSTNNLMFPHAKEFLWKLLAA